ncbi:MAG: hypothetical protein ACI36Z_10030 [Alloprevotella sp.]
MNNFSGLREILTNKIWDMSAESIHEYRDLLEKNLSLHIPLLMEPEKEFRTAFLSSRNGFSEALYVGDAEYIKWRHELDTEDQVINVVWVEGPITRNGGACSHGSKQIRDRVIKAADMDQTIGHLFILDSEGGSSAAKYDFKYAIDYLHEKGQKAIALIDGTACSACYSLACQCDEIYFMDGKNTVGCIGTMAAFTLAIPFTENERSHDRYVELYSDYSGMKNEEIRKAQDGDYSEIVADLNQSALYFINLVKENRPNVTEEQLQGAAYNAEDAVGTLVDGQGTIESCVNRILELTATPQPAQEPASEPEPSDAGEPCEEQDDEDKKRKKCGETHNDNEDKNLNQNDMKEYKHIQAACGAPALESDKEEHLFLHRDYCEALDSYIERAEQNQNALSAKMEEIGKLTATIEQLKSEHQEAIEKLNAEHQEVVSAKDAEISSLKEQNEKAQAELDEKSKEIEQLSQQPTEAPAPQQAPQSDASGMAEKEVNWNVCKPEMTAKERREAIAKRTETLRRTIYG